MARTQSSLSSSQPRVARLLDNEVGGELISVSAARTRLKSTPTGGV